MERRTEPRERERVTIAGERCAGERAAPASAPRSLATSDGVTVTPQGVMAL